MLANKSFVGFCRVDQFVKLQKNSTSSLSHRWFPMDPQPEPVSYICGDAQQRKKVVVCGGGVIGVCTAYFLSKKGAVVTLIEKSSVACAASGKAGGFLALDWCDGGSLSSLARASFNLHRLLSEELNGPQSYGYRPLTTLSLDITEASSSSGSPLYKSQGPKLPSWVDGPAKSPRILGTTETTAQVHPKLFTKTLLNKAVEEYGLEVVTGKLEEVEVAEGRVKAVVLERGTRIEADAVVLALGPWTSKLSLLRSSFRVSGLKAHSIILEPKDPDAITPHALFLSYYSSQGGKPMDPEVYPRPTGEVYICGMSARAEVPHDPEQISPVPESIRVLKRVASNVSSHLAESEVTVKAAQACFLPCTDDGMPVIGEMPSVKGCFLVLDGHSSIVDITPFSPSRFAFAR
ncbi:unnamed protein product [Coffea canephora]|uniref:FAD dependent oxidoreductase domain-containing protein n=1 Tax=Coffea canephora TaxID=49390 RepID=A0A068V3B1_COFCA|nr:unnamed protein product [Coffea canephora]